MILELFVFFEIVTLVVFFMAFFTKQEILWGITAVLAGALMFSSYDIQYYVYVLNATLMAYEPIMKTFNYPYLMGINALFFVLALVLGFFDIFEKYGVAIKAKFKRGR